MANALADYASAPMRAGTKGTTERVHMMVKGVVGTASAVTSSGDPGCSIAKNAVGIWDVVFPACKDGLVRAALYEIGSTGNDGAAQVLAYDMSAGTAQVQYWDFSAGAVASPTAADVVVVEIIGEPH